MGEVYRADDLKLGQTVALKFLPEDVRPGTPLLERFLAEVRLSRQVSHPNVCRVYDVGEAEGRHFLSMEYVDGEDLASLLRRIGHLPGDKGLDVARQLCAGVGAAHEKGVLHRDLKPANVMLDGRGRIRVTDFGLAVLAEESALREGLAGTPAYMAPEQLAGRPATARSDVFALGLVLYEIFTGRRAFEAASTGGATHRHAGGEPTPAPVFPPGVDPAVERVILRCLERDPAARPSSVREVSSALPGGDPLAAALAAGETPSPEMVAAAGGSGTFAPGPARALLAAVVALLGAVLLVSGLARDVGLAPPERSRDFLEDRAREVVARLGWTAPPADSAGAFARDYTFLSWMARNAPPGWARRLAGSWWTPSVYRFRRSPQPLLPRAPGGRVSEDDPPMAVAGMVTVVLDGAGRLRRLQAVPQRVRGAAPPSTPPGWRALFAEAGLDPARFVPSEPAWLPTVPFERIAAWTGSVPGMPEAPLAVVAATSSGLPVSFELVAPWSAPERETERPAPLHAKVAELALGFLALCVTAAGLLLARRNLRLGRGDLPGAFRLAAGAFLLALGAHLLGSHLSAAPGAFERTFWASLGGALAPAVLVAVVYLALEPELRRRYPELLVSWTRLLSGRLRDALVGRDALLGAVAGLAVSLVLCLENAPPALFAAPGQTPLSVDTAALSGPAGLASYAASAVAESLVWLSVTVASLLFGRLLLRHALLAAAATWLVLFLKASGQENPLFEATGGAVIATVLLAVLFRGGVLGLAVALGTLNLLSRAPITPDLSRWFAGYGLACLAAVLAVALYGYRVATGGGLASRAPAATT